MKVEFPGLLEEPMPSGNVRYRVRVEGNKAKRIKLNVTPAHPDFQKYYEAARQGIELPPPDDKERVIERSVAWLVDLYLKHCEHLVEAGLMSPKTERKKSAALRKVREEYGEMDMNIPRSETIKMRDARIATPAAADDLVKHISTMYTWAVETNKCEVNPAQGIGKIDPGKGGADAWSIEDLNKYRAFHQPGTTAHLALTMLMFTAGRIGDMRLLGRHNESVRDGIRWLSWQPEKKGSKYVSIPMLEPLFRATRSVKVLGPTYLLTAYGKPYSGGDSLSARFISWCDQAGLKGRSAHGIRKAAGNLLAQSGATQHQIMAIHGHAEAQTSEIYTRDVARSKMAADAIAGLNDIAETWDTPNIRR